MPDALMSDFDAVNLMLSAIGEAPVNTLSGTLPADVSLAVSILTRTRRQVLMEGWKFNTEYDVTTSLDSSNNVVISPTTLKAELTFPDGSIDPVQRGVKLYDRKNKTYVFSVAPKMNFVYLLAWADLTEQARAYIALRSARVFQAQTVGATELDGYTARDEAIARATLAESDEDASNYNILTRGAGRFYQYRRA